MKNYTTSLFTFLFITIIVPCGFSQTDESNEAKPYKKSYWFDIGGGWGGQGSAFNIGFSYELVPKRLISIRYSSVWTNDHCDEIAFIIPIENPIGKSGDSFEVSYGLLKKGKIGMVNASAGLSLVKVETAGGDGPSTQSTPPFFYTDCPDDYSIDTENTVGLALRAQFIPSLRWVGVGISPYININPKYTFGSLTINLVLGRLKPRTL